MQFKAGVSVVTAAGEHVGHVERVVMSPDLGEVTHLVVEKGTFLTEDKVVPVRFVQTADDHRVVLGSRVDDLKSLPSFEETHYLPLERRALDPDYADEYAEPVLSYPPPGVIWGDFPGPHVNEVVRNVPTGSVVVEEGERVVSAEGRDVGEVTEVLTDTNDHTTHLVVSAGWLFKDKKAIPIHWVSGAADNKIRLAVRADVLEGLPEYRG